MTLKERIYAYFQKNPKKWIPSTAIERLVQKNTTYSASNAARRCRELAQAGALQREEKGGLAWFRFDPARTQEAISRALVAWFDSLPCCPLQCEGGESDQSKCKTMNPITKHRYSWLG